MMFLDQLVYHAYRDKNEITQEEQKLWQIYFKEENEKIRKGHVRIPEKIKDIRQNFSKAIVAGTYQEWQWKNCV